MATYLQQRGLSVTQELRMDLLKVVDKWNCQTLFVKIFISNNDSDNEKRVGNWRAVGRIEGSFRRLIIPEVVETRLWGAGLGGFVIMSWEEGRNFNDRWDERKPETLGGKSIGLYTTDLIVELLSDLGRINATEVDLEESGFATMQEQLQFYSETAVNIGSITRHQAEESRRLFEPISGIRGLPARVSSGDFQLRNFIEVGLGRTAVVDWDDAVKSPYELENCVAYQWLLMWNNPEWQRLFLKKCQRQLGISKSCFRAMLALNTLRQSLTWKDSDYLSRQQISYFVNLLKPAYFDSLWEDCGR